MANHALPATSSTYANFVIELNARIDDAIKWTSSANTSPTNPPTNTVRWNNTSLYWEYNSGTPAAPTWSSLSSRYAINIDGTVGATAPTTGAFTTLTTSSTTSLAAGATVGGIAITTATNIQTLTNKTLTSPIFSSIVNTGTLTLPTITDTLVGRLTTDTLQNKTLTDPKFTSASAIKDANGINLILFPSVIASAINYLAINNSITAVNPSIVATGTDTDIGITLTPKGAGKVSVVGAISSSGDITNSSDIPHKNHWP